MIPRVVYVDGQYVAYGRARIHVEDRGFQFADAVYEVCALRGGRILDRDPHLDRLDRSLASLRIAPPMSRRSLEVVISETVRRNGIVDGLLYMQVTRGISQRDHAFPQEPIRPGVVILARPVDLSAIEARAKRGIAVRTMPDNRWVHRDIKTTGLLGNVLGKQAAREAGASEVWFTDPDGFVTEGGSTNAWIVDARGRLRTRALGQAILPGITRERILTLLSRLNIRLDETPFSVAEAASAREAFSTSAVALLVPVVEIDGAPVGDGQPGPVAKAIRESYLKNVARTGV